MQEEQEEEEEEKEKEEEAIWSFDLIYRHPSNQPGSAPEPNAHVQCTTDWYESSGESSEKAPLNFQPHPLSLTKLKEGEKGGKGEGVRRPGGYFVFWSFWL